MPSPCCTTHHATYQPMREQNIQAIVNYYASGIKSPNQAGFVGIELEHTIVRKNLQPVSYSGNTGVAQVLESLQSVYPDTTYDDNNILGVSRPQESITIEPAAQLELSAGPFNDLHHAKAVFDQFENTLACELARIDAHALATGYHPHARACDLQLIPKQRYAFMNDYLGACDTCGVCMMRGSASTQVSIDYFSKEDCVRKLRLAFALTPILSLICDNSPVFEGKKRTHKLIRTHIWNHTDANRSGLVPQALSPAFTLEDYASYILDTPAILVRNKTIDTWEADNRTFGEIYAHTLMTKDDIEHALSMFFTDVRLKTYLEIRPADALPSTYAIAYAALIKGLFYCNANLSALDALFEGITPADYEAAKQQLMAYGYDARVYHRPVAEICDTVLHLALQGLPSDEQHLLEPLSRLIEQRTTLADIAEQAGFCKAQCINDEITWLNTNTQTL